MWTINADGSLSEWHTVHPTVANAVEKGVLPKIWEMPSESALLLTRADGSVDPPPLMDASLVATWINRGDTVRVITGEVLRGLQENAQAMRRMDPKFCDIQSLPAVASDISHWSQLHPGTEWRRGQPHPRIPGLPLPRKSVVPAQTQVN
jgi:hypothetical protein